MDDPLRHNAVTLANRLGVPLGVVEAMPFVDMQAQLAAFELAAEALENGR